MDRSIANMNELMHKAEKDVSSLTLNLSENLKDVDTDLRARTQEIEDQIQMLFYAYG